MAAPWQRSFAEQGVTVHTRPGAGGNLPEFRGTTMVRATVWEVLAVIEDLNRVCEWAKRCVASKELRRDSFARRIYYNRTGAPWPFADRDSVMLGVVSGMEKGLDVRLSFTRATLAAFPPIDGVVRMPVMKGQYRIIYVSPTMTRVIFQLRAHPGGWIPDWVAAWVSKRIPIDTLVGLRKQVRKTRGRYEAFLNKWDPARRKQPVGGVN